MGDGPGAEVDPPDGKCYRCGQCGVQGGGLQTLGLGKLGKRPLPTEYNLFQIEPPQVPFNDSQKVVRVDTG